MCGDGANDCGALKAGNFIYSFFISKKKNFQPL